MPISQTRKPRDRRRRSPAKVIHPRPGSHPVISHSATLALGTVLAREGLGTGGKLFLQTHQFHPWRVRVGVVKLFFKKARSAANRISCHPTAPYLMRSHFISRAPGGHHFSAANRGIHAKFQRGETIIPGITETFWASPRQDPVIQARGVLHSHVRASVTRRMGSHALYGDSRSFLIQVPASLCLPGASIPHPPSSMDSISEVDSLFFFFKRGGRGRNGGPREREDLKPTPSPARSPPRGSLPGR